MNIIQQYDLQSYSNISTIDYCTFVPLYVYNYFIHMRIIISNINYLSKYLKVITYNIIVSTVSCIVWIL